jgi:hypothetical protein
MYGNNKQALKIRKISIPFYDNLFNTPNGQRFYFPEHPEIDKATIVGIEAHFRRTPPGGFAADLDTGLFQNNLPNTTGRYVYLSFFNEEKEEIFANVPMMSIFGRFVPFALNISPKQKIKPYSGKIKTKNCFAYIPANAPIVVNTDFNINLTFYIR